MFEPILNIWHALPTVVTTLVCIGAIVGVVLFGVAYLTYAERKVLAAMQLRRGPNVVGPFGLLQPVADGIKLLGKETIIPTGANPVLFIGAPILTFLLALASWAVVPFNAGLVLADINVGILYLLAISSLGVYGIIIAGWASNSKYAFLGGLRSAAQMVSYEVSIGLVIITVLLCVGSLNLSKIVMAQQDLWFVFNPLLFPMAVVFFISALAETNRHPFDLPEGESELVGGFNTEYSSMSFALFFLGEYANMILLSGTTSILFLGGWLPPFAFLDLGRANFIWFALKIAFVLFLFLWVRAALPRYRYDQLMRIGWKCFCRCPWSGLSWFPVICSIAANCPAWREAEMAARRARAIGLAIWMAATPAKSQDPGQAAGADAGGAKSDLPRRWRKPVPFGKKACRRRQAKCWPPMKSCRSARLTRPAKPSRKQCQRGAAMLTDSARSLQRGIEVYGSVSWLMSNEMRLFYGATQNMATDAAAALRRVNERTNGRPCASRLQPGG